MVTILRITLAISEIIFTFSDSPKDIVFIGENHFPVGSGHIGLKSPPAPLCKIDFKMLNVFYFVIFPIAFHLVKEVCFCKYAKFQFNFSQVPLRRGRNRLNTGCLSFFRRSLPDPFFCYMPNLVGRLVLVSGTLFICVHKVFPIQD